MKIDEIPVSKKSGPGREIFEIEKIQKKFRAKNRSLRVRASPGLLINFTALLRKVSKRFGNKGVFLLLKLCKALVHSSQFTLYSSVLA